MLCWGYFCSVVFIFLFPFFLHLANEHFYCSDKLTWATHNPCVSSHLNGFMCMCCELYFKLKKKRKKENKAMTGFIICSKRQAFWRFFFYLVVLYLQTDIYLSTGVQMMTSAFKSQQTFRKFHCKMKCNKCCLLIADLLPEFKNG